MIDPTIKSFRAAGETSSPSGFQKVAEFDVALGPDLTIHRWRLIRTPSGRLESYPPTRTDGQSSASVAPAFRAHISELAAEYLESPLDRNPASAN